MRKKLAIDISDFPTMRRENYLYVDKTRHIYELVTQGKFYFLARPRRFGKTLLISTLQEEIDENFDEYVAWFAQEKKREKTSVSKEMMEWYNGYQFSEVPVKVYNPFSVQYYLTFLRRANYWFATGTPTFLIYFFEKTLCKFGYDFRFVFK